MTPLGKGKRTKQKGPRQEKWSRAPFHHVCIPVLVHKGKIELFQQVAAVAVDVCGLGALVVSFHLAIGTFLAR